MASRTAYSTWTPQKPTICDGHYLRNRSTLDIGVLGYIGIVQHKEHSPEVLSIPPGTPFISHHISHNVLHIISFHIISYIIKAVRPFKMSVTVYHSTRQNTQKVTEPLKQQRVAIRQVNVFEIYSTSAADPEG